MEPTLFSPTQRAVLAAVADTTLGTCPTRRCAPDHRAACARPHLRGRGVTEADLGLSADARLRGPGLLNAVGASGHAPADAAWQIGLRCRRWARRWATSR